jgi:hypothetical protein
MYYFPFQPPYILCALGFFVALTCGLAFAGTLKMIVNTWTKDGAEKNANLSLKQCLLPFLGITIGIIFFMCSGLEIFGFPRQLAYTVGLPISLFTCGLVWFQLGSMLNFVERKGDMQSLDLDSMR